MKLLTTILAFFISLAGYNDDLTQAVTIEAEQKLAAGSQPEISVDDKGVIHIVYGIKNGNERDLLCIFK